MKRPVVLALLLLPALLTGCAAGAPADTSSDPSPTPTPDANADACAAFAALTDETADLVLALWSGDAPTGADARLEAIPDEFDMLALRSTGAVAERISDVTALLQETAPIVMSTNPDDYFAAIESVQRACAAEGFDIAVVTWK